MQTYQQFNQSSLRLRLAPITLLVDLTRFLGRFQCLHGEVFLSNLYLVLTLLLILDRRCFGLRRKRALVVEVGRLPVVINVF